METGIKRKLTLFITILFLFASAGISLTRPAMADDQNITIKGKIVTVIYGVWMPFVGRRATIIIKDSSGKEHTVYAGHRTGYVPRRTPVTGDKVEINCIKNKGVWAAVLVTYK